MAFQYDYSTIGEVADAVRDAGGDVSPDFYPAAPSTNALDRNKIAREHRARLGNSIASAFAWRDGFHSLWSTRVAERNHRDLETVAKLAGRLSELLDQDDAELVRLLSDRFPAPTQGTTLWQGAAVLRELQKAATEKRAELASSGLLDASPIGQLPPSGNAAGGWDNVQTSSDAFTLGLMDAFREFFGEPKILQDEDREPCGPFVAFVQAVRLADGEPVTAAAVKKAVDRANGRGRDRQS